MPTSGSYCKLFLFYENIFFSEGIVLNRQSSHRRTYYIHIGSKNTNEQKTFRRISPSQLIANKVPSTKRASKYMFGQAHIVYLSSNKGALNDMNDFLCPKHDLQTQLIPSYGLKLKRIEGIFQKAIIYWYLSPPNLRCYLHKCNKLVECENSCLSKTCPHTQFTKIRFIFEFHWSHCFPSFISP